MLKNEDPLLTLATQAHIPGLSVCSINQGKLSNPIVRGVTNSNLNIPVKPNTPFVAASLTKPFFAYLVLKLIEKGVFSRPSETPMSGLDRPLYEMADFGPEHLRTHPYYKLITPRFILSHQTGLANFFLRSDNELRFLFKPGTEFGYSGIAYHCLQLVVEKITGETFETLASQLFADLEMHHSSVVRPLGVITADLHNEDMQAEPRTNTSNTQHASAAGSLYTTAQDYARFLKAWMNDPLWQCAFKPAVMMTNDSWAVAEGVPSATLQNVAWGLGWGLQICNGETIAFHWGDNGGSKAFVAFNPSKKTGIVYFANAQYGLAIARDILASIQLELDSGLNYLVGKFAYVEHDAPDFNTAEQKIHFLEVFGKHALHDYPEQQEKLKTAIAHARSEIDRHPENGTSPLNATVILKQVLSPETHADALIESNAENAEPLQAKL